MPSTVASDAVETTDLFFTMLKSLEAFDTIEVHGVVNTLLMLTEREQCFIATYRRSRANVGTLLELTKPKHFQAIAMLARNVFELAVDLGLLNALPLSSEKMTAFVDVEKLRVSKKILAFKAVHPSAAVETAIHDSFVAANASRIDAVKAKLWPNLKKVEHWSGMRLSERVKTLGAPFDFIYEVHYPHLSWQVHSGLTGVVNLKAETFTVMCGVGFQLAVDSYWEALSAIIQEFKIEKANEKIKHKMQAAKYLPLTQTPEEAKLLLRGLNVSA